MASVTRSPGYLEPTEYYDAYQDSLIFDYSELSVNKYSIVIVFWVGIAVFVVILFLVLWYMSRTDSPHTKSTTTERARARERGVSEGLSLLPNPTRSSFQSRSPSTPNPADKGTQDTSMADHMCK
ncbi:melanocortin-2 receptor accessory protein [Discoglossus pictus]